jgi:hypothetical protein
MPISKFTIFNYKLNIQVMKLLNINPGPLQPLPTPPRTLDLWCGTQLHGNGIQGQVRFEDGASPNGNFTKKTPFDNKFVMTLPLKDFSDIYALLRSEKPVYLRYNGEKTFENAADGSTVKILTASFSTGEDGENVGEGIDQTP